MHALPSHPRNPILFGLIVLLAALAVMAAAAPELGTLDFSTGGSGAGAPTETVAPVGGTLEPSPATPTWVSQPLAPPLEELAR
ncbi:MAG TPA: hypothetical protein VHF89_21330 [Solirubrobacteraceae bacterium]|nr:hypothetical protein [Solirubrobacteraceae bacterium]